MDLGRTRHLAREVAYCLRVAGAVESAGRDRRGILYRLPEATGRATTSTTS